MSLLFPSRCVLILGDEGLQIYNVGRMGAKFIDFVPWDTVDFEVSVSNAIVKRCKRSPVVVLNDMVEQHYRKERIPNVAFFDKANILKRRLGVAFPNYKVRAALKLKDTKASPGAKGKGSPYLFAAIPASEAFTKTLEAVRRSMAPILGVYLLPVEGAAMVKTLSIKLSKGARYKADWTIFMGQHFNGGLRQIVVKNGELALTRLTPIVDTDVEPDLWAKEISGELGATMSYLSRLGYKEADGLEIIVVANEGAAEALENAITVECDLKVVTSEEAASLLNVKTGYQEDLRYADPLHAAYVGKSRQFQLPMQAMAIDRLTKPRRIAFYMMVGLALGCAYLGYGMFQKAQKAVSVEDQLTVAIQQNQSLSEEYKIELDKKKALGFDFLYVNNSIKLYSQYDAQRMKPLPVIREIARALGADLYLDRFVVTLDEVAVEGTADPYSYTPQENKNEYYIDSVLTISFPNTIDPDVGVDKVNNFQKRLQSNLPNHQVRIIKQVADLSYTGNFVGGAGTGSNANIPEKYSAEIQVRGLIQ